MTNDRDANLDLNPWNDEWERIFEQNTSAAIAYITLSELYQVYGKEFLTGFNEMMQLSNQKPTANMLEKFMRSLMNRPNLVVVSVEVRLVRSSVSPFQVNLGFTE